MAIGDRAHLKGRTYGRITRAWQQTVTALLDDKESGWNRSRLARALHCTPGTVTNMLRPGTRHSRFVDPVCRLLEISPPEGSPRLDEVPDADAIDELLADAIEDLRIIHDREPSLFAKQVLQIRRHARSLLLAPVTGKGQKKP